MTNAERKDKRFERRLEKRRTAKMSHAEPFDKFSNVTDFNNLYVSYLNAKKNVSWKNSIQKYGLNVFRKIIKTKELLESGTDVRKGFVKFVIRERGKARQIKSVHIEERVVQKCLCDFVLVPILTRSLIYDNGASRKYMGMAFSEKRLKKHLLGFYKQNKSNKGYALMIDFSKYFDNIDHEILLRQIYDKINDEELRKLIHSFITAFDDAENKGKSIGLGSQVSQICAIYYPNIIDHFIKEKLRIKGYGRYMDDMYLVHEDKKYLQYCLKEIDRLCAELKITINLKKTRICKLQDGVSFLKGRYRLLERGRVLVTPSNNQATIRMKRKIRKLADKIKEGKTSYTDIFLMYYSWRQGFLKRFSAYKRILSVDDVFWSALKDYHLSNEPPVLNVQPKQLLPLEKTGVNIVDRSEALLAFVSRTSCFYKEYEAGYEYASGFVKSG